MTSEERDERLKAYMKKCNVITSIEKGTMCPHDATYTVGGDGGINDFPTPFCDEHVKLFIDGRAGTVRRITQR